jgi:hypothetical protein
MIAIAILYSIVYSVLYATDPDAITAVVTMTALVGIIYYAIWYAGKIKDRQTIR